MANGGKTMQIMYDRFLIDYLYYDSKLWSKSSNIIQIPTWDWYLNIMHDPNLWQVECVWRNGGICF